MIIYIVRHAEQIPGGVNDHESNILGLSDYGRIQARAAGKGLKKLGIKKIFSSPIHRAKETAELISEACDVEIVFDDRLKEFFTDLYETDPVANRNQKKLSILDPNIIFPNGESLNTAIDRFNNFLASISDREDPICLVTHRFIFESFLSKFFHIKNKEVNWLKNASITAIEQSRNGSRKLIFVNKITRDLPLILQTLKRKFC